jgi:hypothetical protein
MSRDGDMVPRGCGPRIGRCPVHNIVLVGLLAVLVVWKIFCLLVLIP